MQTHLAVQSAIPTHANLRRSSEVSWNWIRDTRGFLSLRDEWQKLTERSDARIFNSWEWLYPWHLHFWQRDHELRILAIRDRSGDLLGILPAYSRNIGPGPLRKRGLALLGDTHLGSDYLDIIARRGCEAEVTHAAAEAILESRSEWAGLEFKDLHPGALALRMMRKALHPRGFRRKLTSPAVCPFGALSESAGERLMGQENLRRRQRWFAKQPGFEISLVRSTAGLQDALRDFYRLHWKRWGSSRNSSVLLPEARSFHEMATRFLGESGKLRLYTLSVGGQAIASVYGLQHHGRFFYYQSGYDPEWSSRSPGLVLIARTFKDAREEGCGEYDFLRGEESYKFDWVDRRRPLYSLQAYSSGTNGGILYSQDLARLAVQSYIRKNPRLKSALGFVRAFA